MKKMLVVVASLLVLSLLIAGCKTGEAGRSTALQCNLKNNCGAVAALDTRVNLLEGKVAELESKLNVGIPTEEYQVCVAEQTGCGIESIGGPAIFGGCPKGTTASSCTDATHVSCTGSQEFGDITINCDSSGSGNVACTGEAPTAKCSTITVVS